MTNDKTVTMSRELAEKIYRHKDRLPSGIIGELRELLSAEAAPVVERQDHQVVGRVYHFDDGARCHLNSEGRNLANDTPLYTSPPAPVAVVLPERAVKDGATFSSQLKVNGWNSCIDKVKELNQ